ncbi:hypothetical protein FBHYGVHD_CDS0073 [Staphylococcus phage MVC_VPHSA1]|uniref:Uncharacterized protein n=1 Tax=Staphylococcus phage MVC_VPHSA1 TaxID=3088876 RepID=A0ABZ0QZC2_9CAUD|nr:hypothetical protein FBHYGVHD_CDS0073 [Staphylococcus phage MVC_VPHSA1]
MRAKLHQRVFDRFFSEYLATQINEIEFDEKIKASMKQWKWRTRKTQSSQLNILNSTKLSIN